MKPAKKTKKRSQSVPRLNRDDWLDAAFQAVVQGGFEQVRVLMLARRLQVTRGSFYWHFADHAELVHALLERWREREAAIATSLEAQASADAGADLERLLDAALAHAGVDLENMRFELALRGLGRRDPAVARMLLAVDQQRMQLFEHKFQRLTADSTTAVELSALFYLAIVGSNQALSRPLGPPQMKETLKRIIATYLIHQQRAAAPTGRRKRS